MADTPKIRFKGFTDDWEWRKLGEVATFINGRAYSQDELLCSGKYKVLRVGNFYTNDSWYYSDMELDDKYYAEEGDLLYTWSATFGPHIWHGDKVIYHYHIWKIELSEHLEKKFALQLLEKDKATILSDKNGSAMVHITKTGMEEKSVLLPINIEEQSKIGMCLDSIDHLITFHQRKCDTAKVLKKYMLQKMFPQNGEKVPEIRFAGFTDDWEQCKLSEIADKVTEKNRNNEFSEPFTNSAEFGIISQKNYFDREVVNQENLDGYYIVRDDDFVYNPRISATAPVGPINRNRLGKNGVMSPLYTVFRTYEIDNLYLEFYFKTTNWHRFMKLNGDSGARFDRFTISSAQFMKMPIPFPNKEEQQKIGKYFDHLDHLITLHQRKCDELKEVKRFMLQNMFPQKGQ